MNCLPHKHEDLSPAFRTPIQLGMVAQALHLSLGDRVIGGAIKPAGQLA